MGKREIRIDDVSRQILFAVAEAEKIKIGDLERMVEASRQTIWNRVNVLVAAGFLKEERDRFPPTRWLSIAKKRSLFLSRKKEIIEIPEQPGEWGLELTDELKSIGVAPGDPVVITNDQDKIIIRPLKSRGKVN